ncbi:MAG TPA: presqualene diphosphate synthase HpnD [Kribbella sp.]|nr:presqualene diphosphate synthase HpnD [Kribbella sp.]
MSTVAEAYEVCEQVTRSEARNFYYGIRLLPVPKRSALSAVYALARRIDDIGDGDLPVNTKSEALDDVRTSLKSLDDSADPVLVAVADAARKYPIPLEAFEELIDGVRMDVQGVTYDTFDELVGYCRCVAGSIGRLCLAVFGPADADPRAPMFADQLGIALQQTNILRDVREDLLNGRIYLPRQELEAFGVELRLDDRGALADPDARLVALLRHAAARAGDWYALGSRLQPLLDRRSAACCRAMAGIYRNLLSQIEADPTRVYDGRLSLTGWQKARVAATALMGSS